jgi:hypothetical protein
MISKYGTGLHHPHFAHRHGVICDSWYEPESDWHINWKNTVPINQREVTVIKKDGTRHIVDIQTPKLKIAVELQYSSLSPSDRDERISFYKKIIFLIHGSQLRTAKNIEIELLQTGCSASLSATPEPWITKPPFNFPLFFDFCNDTLLHVKSMDRTNGSTTIIQGSILSKEKFISTILNNPYLNYESLLPGYECILKDMFDWMYQDESNYLDVPMAIYSNCDGDFYMVCCPHCLKNQKYYKIITTLFKVKEYLQCSNKKCERFFTGCVIPFNPISETHNDDAGKRQREINIMNKLKENSIEQKILVDITYRNEYQKYLKTKKPFAYTKHDFRIRGLFSKIRNGG